MRVKIYWDFSEMFWAWMIVVEINSSVVCVLFRPTEAECRAWADRNIVAYVRGRPVHSW